MECVVSRCVLRGESVCQEIWIASEWWLWRDVRGDLVGLRKKEVHPRGVCHRVWVVGVGEVVAWAVCPFGSKSCEEERGWTRRCG